MKDKILNILMLAAVAAALGLSLLRGGELSPAASSPDTFSLLSTAAASPLPTLSPIDAYRAERMDIRAQEISALETLLQNGAEGDVRSLAEAQLATLVQYDEIELAVEAALAAHNCPDGLCVARQGEITVLLPRAIPAEDASLFLEIARQASGFPMENIRISDYAF